MPDSNLPRELSSFVGRAAELQRIPALLKGSRLLTITGPGGIGKTRLALHAASMMGSRYPDGVWLADMSLVMDGRDVLRAVGTALGSDQPADTAIEPLLDRLRTRRVLIVLDNCEHVVGSCAELTRSLLGYCLGVSILATSRQVLGVAGEVVCRTPPLSLPLENESSVEGLQQSEAACLFLERVVASVPAFTLTAAAIRPVAEICRGLDGVPLALELAAGRVRNFGLSEVAAIVRDHKRLDNLMLADAERVLHQRLALLDGAVARSYSARLTPRECNVLALLARGCSNKEIGAELAISDATARVHVEHILTKLDLRSRTQAAVWALRRGAPAALGP